MAQRPQTAKIVLIAVLGLALGGVLLRQFVLSGGTGKPPATGTPAQTGKGGQSPTQSAPPAQPAPPKVQVQWKRPDPLGPLPRDPMQIDLSKQTPQQGDTSQVAPARPRFAVTGIVFNVEQPSSIIIDGRILHEGDTIYGATVTKITENSAELSRGDKKWTVRPGESNEEPE